MTMLINGITVQYPAKLEPRKSEVEELARSVLPKKNSKKVKVWETKRGDLAAVITK